jgi:hypothetical protein
MDNGLTPLSTRLAAVWLSLRTRWLYLLLVAAFVCMVVGFGLELDRQRSHPPRLQNVLSSGQYLRPHIQLLSPTALSNDATLDEARSISAYAELTEWRASLQNATLPKLEAVTLIASRPDDLAWLALQPKLSTLKLMTIDKLSAADLSVLSEARGLRRLSVVDDVTYRTAEAIAWPPNLEVVDLSTSHGLTVQRLRELSQLPRLHTLSIRLQPVDQSSQLPDDVVAALRSFPALRRLYLLEMPTVYPELIHEAQRALPGIAVRPATYDEVRVSRLTGLVLLLSAWTALVGVMLSPQFVIAPSVLLPGYRRPHVLAATVVFLVGLAVTLGLMSFAGGNLLASVGLCGGALTFIGLMVLWMRRIDPGTPGFTQPFLAFPVFVFTVPLLQLMIWAMPGEMDWFLRGEQPGWAAALTLSGVLLTLDAGRWLTSLHRRVEAHGRGGCPLSAGDFEGWKVWALTAQQHRQPTSGWWDWYTGAERRLAAAIEHPATDAAGRRRLWRAGFQIGSLRGTTFATISILIFLGGLTVFNILFVGEHPLRPGTLIAAGLGYAAFFAIYMPLIFLTQRQPCFPLELLRPVTRTDWVRDWFVVSAVDVSPGLVLAALALAVAWWQGLAPVPPPAHWPPIAALFLGGWVALWSGGLWLMTYRWAAIGLVVLLSMAGSFLFALGVTSQRFVAYAWATSLAVTWTLAMTLLLLAAGLFFGARHRWQTREFAA